MPGFHLQKAQPVTLFFTLPRTAKCFTGIYPFFGRAETTNLCPLGSGALAGTTGINREMTAKELGFVE